VVDPRPSAGPDPYEVLGVAPTADAAEIARAYRRRVREVHPDTADPAREPARDDGSVELGAIQDAYLVLRDPVRRAQYDRERAGRSVRPTASVGVPVPVRVHVRPAPVQPPLLRVGPVRVESVPRRGRRQYPSN
jgi:curved DNA-binding protein CbpA